MGDLNPYPQALLWAQPGLGVWGALLWGEGMGVKPMVTLPSADIQRGEQGRRMRLQIFVWSRSVGMFPRKHLKNCSTEGRKGKKRKEKEKTSPFSSELSSRLTGGAAPSHPRRGTRSISQPHCVVLPPSCCFPSWVACCTSAAAHLSASLQSQFPRDARPPLERSILWSSPRHPAGCRSTETPQIPTTHMQTDLAKPTLTKSSISGSFTGRLSIAGIAAGGHSTLTAVLSFACALRRAAAAPRGGLGLRLALSFPSEAGRSDGVQGGGSCGASQL